MSRFLAIDVGAGTLDAMFLDTTTGDLFKFVAKSPTRSLAEKIMACNDKRILVTGRAMGGGPVTDAIKNKAREITVMMTPSAAQTIHHRLERIEKLGVIVISEDGAKRELRKKHIALFRTGDILAKDIMTILRSMGIEPVVDFLAIAVQDHGTPTTGVSSLDFRHQIFKRIIEASPTPSAFLFEAEKIPSYLHRMHSAALDAQGIPSTKVFLMDTGMAAILGASSDPWARGKEIVIVLDIATSHTLGALLVAGEIGGFFEYHTSAITTGLLRSLIINLAEGRLSHEQIVAEGGHGAYVRKAVGFDRVEVILATGPKRDIVNRIGMDHIVLGAPFGDNMMTGTAGLILAVAEREGCVLSGMALEARETHSKPSHR
jgi:uncharacterized protein (DUF1786 family)